jgi:hypothetical protein
LVLAAALEELSVLTWLGCSGDVEQGVLRREQAQSELWDLVELLYGGSYVIVADLRSAEAAEALRRDPEERQMEVE